jgi:serine/threonine protein kinase
VDDSEGVPVIAMEYVDGQALDVLLRAGPLPADRAADLGRQIAQGMAAAHGLGIVHGDLKPGNLLVTHGGVVKVTDFGLSRRAPVPQDSEQTLDWSLVDEGTIGGTPAYMSPEQSRGEPLTPMSDVFSLGAVLSEMLTGRPAFTGDNVLRVLEQIRNVDPERYAAEVPEPFRAILRRSFIHEARDRALTMERIAEMLR